MRLAIGVVLIVAALLGGVWGIYAEVMADYEIDRAMGSFWSLSEKASTLDVKSAYLNKFVTAVEDAKLSGNDAVFLKTPDNDFEQNMTALHSLQLRMNEIKGMDVTSFAYQQAIQQITAQEQGEAEHLLGTISGVWYLREHPLLWGWIDFMKWIALVIAGIVGMFLIIDF